MNELVARLLDGQGLPWPKPPYLKQVASQERARVLALRMLETRLGVRRPTDTVMATSTQMRPVVSESVQFEVVFCVYTYRIVGGIYQNAVFLNLAIQSRNQ